MRHRNLKTSRLVLSMLMAMMPTTYGMSPNPEPYEIEQPDGSVIMAQMMGDEENPHEECATGEDCEGFTIMGAGPAGNEYQFAILDDNTGQLAPSGVNVKMGQMPPSGVSMHIRRSPGAAMSMGFGGLSAVPGELMGSSSSSSVEEFVPNRRLDHIDLHEDFTSATEDFHRRTMAWTGRKNNLVIPLLFKDHRNRWKPPQSGMNKLFNQVGGDGTYAPTGSIRDIFRTSSYGKLDMVSTVVDWIELPETEAYYADGNRGFTFKMHEAIQYALEYLENTKKLNFGQFDTDNDGLIDSICFLHSGYAAEWGGNSKDGANYLNRIWSHKWGLYGIRAFDGGAGWKSKTHGVKVMNYHISPARWGTGHQGDEIGRVGVIAHETGHFLGITDLYDTSGEKGNGIGSWGLMANSWGFDNTQKCPPIMGPWSKSQLDWVSPTVISSPGDYTIKPSYASSSQGIYKISKNFDSSTEYLLIEFRKPTGIESCMPTKGVAVWHIDDLAEYSTQGYPGQAGWPGNGNHYRVALLQADGQYDLEKNKNRGDAGDLFVAGQSIGPGYDTSTKQYVYPNTDSYQEGNVKETGITITVKSVTDDEATVNIRFGDDDGSGGGGGGGEEEPMIRCGWKKPFRLIMTTDKAGADMSWEISNGKNPSQVFKTGGGYPNNVEKRYVEDLCLNPGFCYKLKVTDRSGNGFSPTTPNAGFSAVYDGDLIHSSPPGQFSTSLSDFGNCKLDGRQSKGFQVGFPADSTFFGNMFDIKATSNVVFSHIQSLHVDNTLTNSVKIWTKNGSYKGFENAKEHWTLISQQTVTGKGRGKRTDLKGFDQFVTVLKGTTQAFYVEIDKKDLLFLNSQGRRWNEGDSWRKTSDFDFLVGIHANRDFGPYGGPSIFNGRLWYGPLYVHGAATDTAETMELDLESDAELIAQMESGIYELEDGNEEEDIVMDAQDEAIMDEMADVTDVQAISESELHQNADGEIGRSDNEEGFKGGEGGMGSEDFEEEVDGSEDEETEKDSSSSKGRGGRGKGKGDKGVYWRGGGNGWN